VLTVSESYIVVPQNVAVFVKHESGLYKLCVCVKYSLATATIVIYLKTYPHYSSALSDRGKLA